MCYHATVKYKGSELAKIVQAPFPKADLFEPIYHANGFAHPNLPTIANGEGGKSVDLFSWGLIPFWVKDWSSAVKLRNQTLNARSEEVFDKPSFRDSIQPTTGNRGIARRCIIPVTGFFEWKHVGKDKIPYHIRPKGHEVFMLAGVYSNWTNPATGDKWTTFSIITTVANELMTDIHNSAKRMPLMIDPGLVHVWLDPELRKDDIIDLMRPCDDRNMAAFTVSRDLSNPKINSNIPSITDHVIYGTN
jgi:putative SOS response-associated peptidase YedK